MNALEHGTTIGTNHEGHTNEDSIFFSSGANTVKEEVNP